MAARYPGAEWRPLGPEIQPRMAAHNIICLHTMAGSLTGTEEWFGPGNGAGYLGTESHFGVGGIWGADASKGLDGVVRQWQDLDYTADANLEGNGDVISIETADNGDTPIAPWSERQLDALGRLVAWLAGQYGIPLELIPDTKPGRRGVGYHAQGIAPNVVPGGRVWSRDVGKTCPTAARIAQVPEVIRRARAYAGLGDAVTPTPITPTHQEDDMYLISSTGRGVALVGADYFFPVPNDEFVGNLLALVPAAQVKAAINDRQFDVWVASLTQGKTDVDAVQAAMAAVPATTAQLVADELARRLTPAAPAA